MQLAFVCPLASASRFCLSGLSVQRNCNATDLHLLGGCSASQLPASEDGRSTQFAARSNRTAGTDGGRRVEFASAAASRSRSKRSRSRRQRSSQHGAQPQTLTFSRAAMLVPLACSSNQSNKQHPLSGCLSANNAQPSPQTESATEKTEQTANPCDLPPAGGSGGGGCGGGQELMANCGVPYWNVYEYEDFRELQHGQSHLFDPQVDTNLHRENIILDNYNRLRRSCSNFLPPASMYHLR